MGSFIMDKPLAPACKVYHVHCKEVKDWVVFARNVATTSGLCISVCYCCDCAMQGGAAAVQPGGLGGPGALRSETGVRSSLDSSFFCFYVTYGCCNVGVNAPEWYKSGRLGRVFISQHPDDSITGFALCCAAVSGGCAAVSGTCHRSVSAAGQFSAARHLLRRQKNTSPLGSNFGFGVTDSREHEPLKIQRMQFRRILVRRCWSARQHEH